MHTAEEVRKEADEYKRKLGTDTTGQMLLAYADLLESMEEIMPGAWGSDVVVALRQRAAEKARNR